MKYWPNPTGYTDTLEIVFNFVRVPYRYPARVYCDCTEAPVFPRVYARTQRAAVRAATDVSAPVKHTKQIPIQLWHS